MENKNIHIISHPLIEHKLTQIRKEKTSTKEFRENVSEITSLLIYEATKKINLKEVTIKTPICETKTHILADEIVCVPILRAGLGMVDGLNNMIPTAKVGHIGLYRNEETLKPCVYYSKFPKGIENNSLVLLVDPMLATGNSCIEAINILKSKGFKNIKYIGIVGAPEGINNLTKTHPDVEVYLACKDEKLNDHGYIVPGLGDCGDRLFGTK